MKKNSLITFSATLLIGCIQFYNLNAQNVVIETTNLAIIDKRLEINYEILHAKKTHRFEVWVEIKNAAGEKINARTLSGNIGENQLGGNDKRIIWDYNADGLVLDEDVSVVVHGTQSTLAGAVNTGSCILKSLIMPGLGISSIEKGKPYWLLGVVGYASLGTSIALRSSYKSNYDKYLNTSDAAEASDYLNKSQSQQSTSTIMLYTAIGSWSVSMIWTIIKATRRNKSLASNNWNNHFNFYTCLDPISRKPLLGLHYEF
jgi:hypothetical protein